MQARAAWNSGLFSRDALGHNGVRDGILYDRVADQPRLQVHPSGYIHDNKETRMTSRIFCLVSALLLPMPMLAQPVSPETRELVVSLIERAGAGDMAEQIGAVMSQQMITGIRRQNPDLSPEQASVISEVVIGQMRRILSDPEYLDGITGIYARHFTQQELQDLVAFYSSPLGEKIVSTQSQIAQESMLLAQQLMTRYTAGIQAELQERLQALGE